MTTLFFSLIFPSPSFAADASTSRITIQVLVDKMFRGSFSQIANFFVHMTAYFAILGISVVVIRFIYAVLKKEINGLEDIFGFMADRGLRFVIAMFFFLPVNIPGVFNTVLPTDVAAGSEIDFERAGEVVPMGFYIFYIGARASFESADELGIILYDKPLLELPFYFKDHLEETSKDLKTEYDQIKDKVTPDQRTLAHDSTLDKFMRTATEFLAGVGGVIIAKAVGTGTGTALLAGVAAEAVTDGAINGNKTTLAKFLAFLRDSIMSINIIIIFYTSIIIALLKFVFYAPFFFFSVVLIFFDKAKDVVYNNIIKWVALMLWPIGIVVAYAISLTGYNIFRNDIYKFIFDTVDAVYATGSVSTRIGGSCVRIVLLLAITGMFSGIVVMIFKTIHSFIQNMLGQSFATGLEGAIKGGKAGM